MKNQKCNRLDQIYRYFFVNNNSICKGGKSMKEQNALGNDIQMTQQHENRFTGVKKPPRPAEDK